MSNLLRVLLDRITTGDLIHMLGTEDRKTIFTSIGEKLIGMGPFKLAELMFGGIDRPVDHQFLRKMLIEALIENDININNELKKSELKKSIETKATTADKDSCGRGTTTKKIAHTC